MLVEEGFRVSVSDIYGKSFEYSSSIAVDGRYQFDVARAPFLEHFDMVGAFDVLEHIDDDTAAVRGMHRLLKPSGIVFATVPALKGLWSASDVNARHKRRYGIDDLQDLFKKNGFTVLKNKYFFVTIVPFLLLRAILYPGVRDTGRAEGHSPGMYFGKLFNRALRFVMNAEVAFFMGLPAFVGGSIAIVGRKENHDTL